MISAFTRYICTSLPDEESSSSRLTSTVRAIHTPIPCSIIRCGQSVTVNKDDALQQVAAEVDGWGGKLDAMTNTHLVAPKPTRLDAQSPRGWRTAFPRWNSRCR